MGNCRSAPSSAEEHGFVSAVEHKTAAADVVSPPPRSSSPRKTRQTRTAERRSREFNAEGDSSELDVHRDRRLSRRASIRRARQVSYEDSTTSGGGVHKSAEFDLSILVQDTAAATTSEEEKTPDNSTAFSTVDEESPLKTGHRPKLNLEDTLLMTQLLLETKADEHSLSEDEVKAALSVYKELQRVLSTATRTGNLMKIPTDFVPHKVDPGKDSFTEKFNALVKECDEADLAVKKALASPAAVQPVTQEALSEVNDFFILDNSLRETTVGAARGHTMEEKIKIVEAMAETDLQEVILGTFGAKVSVDSQVAQTWTQKLGKTFDSAWGFSDAFDMTPVSDEEEEKLWSSLPEYMEAEQRGETVGFFTPSQTPKFKYSKDEIALFKKASKGFRRDAFGGLSLDKVLKKSQDKVNGRVPLGLLMMAGYGICNAIVEIDTSVETFDYDSYDLVDRCKFLIRWCKENLPRRKNVPEGQDNTARVLVNLRDFSNYNRSKGGNEEALRVVHELSSLPPDQRPFGFIIEEPTGYLWPDEVGRLCKMIRMTMNRAGFPEGKLLVHIHWYFGMAEAVQLTCLANGADGVWAAVCKVGAQTGHACSTMTAVNLLRAGNKQITNQYNLSKMCKAAREVTEISTRQPCPKHEEVYGEHAFDVPYFMTAIPACRYALAKLLKELEIDDRIVRLNEIIVPSAIERAMTFHFGPAEVSGWDPVHCKKMFAAIHDHLLTGLSRDYNTPLGLGHLYGLVSQKELPTEMVSIMMKNAPISDYHPTVLEFISRWNRLCHKYQGKDEPLPGSQSKSIMMLGLNMTTQHHLENLPFEYFMSDVMRNPVLEQVPRLFKMQVVSLITKNERHIQGRRVPVINFYDAVLRLKLFILEADSLGVMGLCDDFAIRKNHDYFFGEDNLWLQKVRGNRPRILNKFLRSHFDFFPKYYKGKGNNAIVRCVRAAAKRIEQNKEIDFDTTNTFRRGSARNALVEVISSDEANMILEEDTIAAEELTKRMLEELRESEEYDFEDDDEEGELDMRSGMDRLQQVLFDDSEPAPCMS